MNSYLKPAVGLLFLLTVAGLSGTRTTTPIKSMLFAQSKVASPARQVLGPVATVSEEETTMRFLARVDTGAQTCSLHAAERRVLSGSEYMEENLGKTIRFRVENRDGESQWLERTIAEVREIRTSEGEEMRYLVPMTFTCKGTQRKVLVSLNDRSRMTYTMLLGRNYLAGQFVVDVTIADNSPELLAHGH